MKQEKDTLKRFIIVVRQMKNFNLYAFLQDKDLKQTEFAVLHMLDRCRHHGENEMKISDVAKRLRNANSTISPIIQSLVEKGYVTRTTSGDDRRISIIVMTEKGKEYFQKAMKDFEKEFVEVLDDFGEEKTEQLLSLLEEFADTIGNVQKERLNK